MVDALLLERLAADADAIGARSVISARPSVGSLVHRACTSTPLLLRHKQKVVIASDRGCATAVRVLKCKSPLPQKITRHATLEFQGGRRSGHVVNYNLADA